jgi:hypothetical protein
MGKWSVTNREKKRIWSRGLEDDDDDDALMLDDDGRTIMM